MAFEHGKLSALYIEGYDLSDMYQKVSIKAVSDTGETTCLGSSSKTYLPGTKDASWTADGFFDGGAGEIDAVMQPLLGAATDSLVTHYPGGEVAIGDVGRCWKSINTTHDIESPVDGIVSVTSGGQIDGGVEHAVSLHPLGAETGAGSETSVNNGAASTAGASGYLHVTAFTGTDITVLVEESANNADWNTLLTFTQVTAARAHERVAATGDVKQYVRCTVSGTFTTCTFSLSFCRF